MKYIQEDKILTVLEEARKASVADVEPILAKSRRLQRLTIAETAVLLSAQDSSARERILATASFVKDAIYGKRVVLFAPLYISNICANNCLYCAFRSQNRLTERKALSQEEIREQVEWLLRRGHKRILMVAGESAVHGKQAIDYYAESIRTIYGVRVKSNAVRRVNVNCAPLSIEEFKRLKEAGIGTYQLFQETYHEATYRMMHPSGPKSDPDNRIDAIDRAFQAGIDDIGLGVLYGLYDWRFETLALLAHIEHLEQRFGVGPHTISVPRIEPVEGADISFDPPHKVPDEDFKMIVAVLRLAVPYTGIILSTRESPSMRDELFSLGVSQVSAESRTSPGGYSSRDNNQRRDIQFSIGDQRTLDEVVASLLERDFIPSFCAACYRKERTGEAFMSLARPGTIKGKCSINALVTLKEYLDDFASPSVKMKGYGLIKRTMRVLSEEDRICLDKLFSSVDSGIRDEYV